MNAQQIVPHVESRLAGFRATADPIPLSGGLINFVWRLPGRPQSVIVKYAAPYIAVLPDVPLDPQRLLFEARSLQLFAPGGRLSTLAQPALRPPRLLDFDPQENLIVLEDAGDAPDLGQWLGDGTPAKFQGHELGQLLGRFFGRLHCETYEEEALQATLNNAAIQQARLSGQYTDTLDYLRRGRVAGADQLGEVARNFGQRLQSPGVCLTMGDLWPPSTLLTENGLRLIDWEFAHFGLPAQDVGHFVAHMWMHTHRAADHGQATRSQDVLAGFLHAYRSALGPRFDEIMGAEGLHQCAIHFGCELLARSIGNYQPGYLYEGLARTSTPVREAVQTAAAALRDPDNTQVFVGLA